MEIVRFRNIIHEIELISGQPTLPPIQLSAQLIISLEIKLNRIHFFLQRAPTPI